MSNPGEWIMDTLWLMTSILLVINVLNAIAGVIDKFKKPENRQNEEIAKIRGEIGDIKRKLETFDRYFDNDDKRIKVLEKGNQVTMKMLLALGRHNLDGNHTAELEKANEEVSEYLTQTK